jgi:uncharacterized protein
MLRAEIDLAPHEASRLASLEGRLIGTGGLLVAFSGGVDSSLLLAAALSVRGPESVLAATVASPLQPEGEVEAAVELARSLGVRHLVLELDPLSDPELSANPPERCYLCKRKIFRSLLELARAEGIEAVVEGSNADDQDDFRPGRRALRELGVRSPLREAGLTKAEIREISHALGLATWDRPALACLASRVPYGQRLTAEVLGRVDRSEAVVRGLGISQVRVRDHGDLARIEVPPDELPRLLDPATRVALIDALRHAGYRYVALDLQGYRTGAMNETLSEELKSAIEGAEETHKETP